LPDSEPPGSSRAAVIIAIVCAAASTASLVPALLPTETLANLGALVRRPDDVTPERVLRLRIIGCGLGAAFALLSGLIWLRRRQVQRFFVDAASELRGFPAEVRRWWETASISNRIAYLLIVAAGAALRLKYLHTPMAYDEAYSFTNFARRPLLEALADYNNTNNHPLNTLLMHVMFRLFGQHEWALRLPVLIAGLLLVAVAFPWARARIGAAPALVVTALLAASPMMIDYSVNARGYTYLTLFAVLLDGCFLRIAFQRAASRSATWIVAALCIWLGFFTMPTFLHPLAGLVAWFLVEARLARANFRDRTRRLAICFAVSGLAVVASYAPACVFRGATAFQNDFVQPLPFTQWANEFPTAVWKGVERWTAGGVPGVLLIVPAWGGIVAWIRRSIDDRRAAGWGAIPIACLLLVPLCLMALQRVAPPPRLFFVQAPWFHLLVAVGAGYAVGLLHRLHVRLPGDGTMRFLAYAVSAAGVWFAFEHHILREPHQRELGVGSVPAAMLRLKSEISDARGGVRLYAPLPCDHPAIFYASKFRAPVEINGDSRGGERLFLLTRPGDDPAKTLSDVVVRQPRLGNLVGPWKEVAKFAELTLWEASRRFPVPIQ
jgi:hypothetical protein